MRVKLKSTETIFKYEDGYWTLIEGRMSPNRRKSSGGVIPGSQMDIVPIGKALTVGLRIYMPATQELLALIPIGRGDQMKAMQVASDWNRRAQAR